MPLPKPRGGKKPESRESFLARCHGDQIARKEFTDRKQLSGYCYNAWERRKAKASYVVAAGEDEYIYVTAKLLLSAALVEKAKTLPQSSPGKHSVLATLKSGKKVKGIISNCEEFETEEDDEEDIENDEVMDIEMEDMAKVDMPSVTASFSFAAKNEGKTLNKPFRLPKGSNKKFGVYVKNEKGNVVMVKFGDPNMEIKRDDPERRKNFRARHGCDNPGPKWKSRHWACKFWSSKPVSQIAGEEEIYWDNLPEQEIDASVEVIEESDV